MKLEKIVALVPMRHDSKRVPGKNYRMMCGKPLYAHIIETLLSVETIDQVVVCLLYTSPSPRDRTRSRMPSSA